MFMKYSIVTRIYTEILINQAVDNFTSSRFRESRIYDRGGEPTIPSRKGAKFQRRCDWWLYKERHLVEKFFLKLKAFRRIATRYDKLPFTFLGFICLASILIWLK